MNSSALEFARMLHNAGQFDRAQAAYESFINEHPRHFEAIHFLGVLHAQQGRVHIAVELFGKAAKIRPTFLQAHYNEGVALNMIGSHERALKSYAAVLRLNPTHADAMKNRVASLVKLERFEDALSAADKFLDKIGDSSEILDMRGVALRDLKRLSEALDCHERALKLDPRNAVNLANRGVVLRELKRSEEAIASFDSSIAIEPESSDAHYGKGVALQKMGHLNEAIASYDRAIQIMPEFAEAYSARGTALNELERFEEAIGSYDRATQIKPDYADAHTNKSLSLLQLGKFDEGWKTYEWRKRTSQRFGARTYRQPEWTGAENIAGKTLFIHWEQGFGTVIQFCRYALLAETLGAKVILSIQDPLMRLLRELSPRIDIVDSRSVPSLFDYHVALLSMPLAFKTDEGKIPAGVPYLRAESDRLERWRLRLGERGFKIGVAWQGSNLGMEKGHSFPVTQLHGISKLQSVRLISLQKHEGSEQLAALPEGMKVETLGDDFDCGPDAFLDTAAVMEDLDLVITTDTSIAHLAGALGRPTWVALKRVPDWRWLLDRQDSPWYPTMRLFRQRTTGDWTGVFCEMEAELARLLAEKQRQET